MPFEQVAPIAASDAELIELVQTLARRGGHAEREFTEARPILDLQLPDGSRLAAAGWVTKRPYVTVRRHLLVDAFHDELVGRAMYDAGVASLLRAFVRARWNVLIAGGQGVGKTTLLRAMLHECSADERLLVLEQEPELHLDTLPERHNHVLVFMERVANMEGVGAVSLADLSRAIQEAELVLDVLRQSDAPIAEDIGTGTYRLLFRVLASHPEEVRSFYEDTVAPIVRYDDQYRTDLVGTLEAYLEQNCNMNATAATIYAHRHTVAYRLDRVKELTGLDPMQSEDRERLGLGLKAYRIIAPRLPR